MKRSRFSEEQIIGVLKEAESGAKTADLARRRRPHPGNLIRHAERREHVQFRLRDGVGCGDQNPDLGAIAEDVGSRRGRENGAAIGARAAWRGDASAHSLRIPHESLHGENYLRIVYGYRCFYERALGAAATVSNVWI